jgi:hypothetical protein
VTQCHAIQESTKGARFSTAINGAALLDRRLQSIRRECLDHIIIFNEDHLRRILRSYFAYYHEDRTHLGLAKDTPLERPVTNRVLPSDVIVALPRVGGLHHRYQWEEAA